MEHPACFICFKNSPTLKFYDLEQAYNVLYVRLLELDCVYIDGHSYNYRQLFSSRHTYNMFVYKPNQDPIAQKIKYLVIGPYRRSELSKKNKN